MGHTFGRQEQVCAALVVLIGIYGIAMLPLRPVILGLAPLLLVTLSGSVTGMAMCGAFAATGASWWPWSLLLGTFGAMKFDPVFWWAGKLWGDHFIASLVGPTPRARRRAKRAEELARRYDILAIAITYIPFLPIPGAIVYAVLGAAGTGVKRFLAADIASAFVSGLLFFVIGWLVGEPAVAALEQFGKYLWYVSIVLVVVVFYAAFRKAKQSGDEAEADTPS